MARMAVRLATCAVLAAIGAEASPVPAPAPSPGPGAKVPCFRTRTKYEPLDMAGTSNKNSATAEDCQTRCSNTKGCVHFSWWLDDGCHLQDAKSNRARADGKALSGPSECESGNFCYKNGVKYDPMNMPGHKRSDTIIAEDCQSRCANTDGCASFVWFPDGGCHIQDENAKQIVANENIVAGGPNCDPTTTSTTTTQTSTTATTTVSTTTTLTTTVSTTTTLTQTTTTVSVTSTITVTTTSTTLTSTTSSSTSVTTSTSSLTSTSSTTSVSSTTSSSTSPPDVCLIPGAQFTPLDMKGEERTEASSPYLCQMRCKKTTGCVHFSWWGDGGCHLQDGTAMKKDANADVMAGPDTCNRFSYCFETRHKWEPLLMAGTDRMDATSPDDCQSKCQNTKGCAHFTFWADGGCHLQDSKAERGKGANDVTAGPVNCNFEWQQDDGWLQSSGDLFIGHMKVEQAKMKCLNLGCAGFTYQGKPGTDDVVKVFIKSIYHVDATSSGQGWVSLKEGSLATPAPTPAPPTTAAPASAAKSEATNSKNSTNSTNSTGSKAPAAANKAAAAKAEKKFMELPDHVKSMEGVPVGSLSVAFAVGSVAALGLVASFVRGRMPSRELQVAETAPLYDIDETGTLE